MLPHDLVGSFMYFHLMRPSRGAFVSPLENSVVVDAFPDMFDINSEHDSPMKSTCGKLATQPHHRLENTVEARPIIGFAEKRHSSTKLLRTSTTT
mmetsp:Transcript_8908/g.26473  ORF Transcript_8908/g.26473 Transcript_8908/m.26473 type:complete len:95 (-) Transcript_8908:124-408(-)